MNQEKIIPWTEYKKLLPVARHIVNELNTPAKDSNQVADMHNKAGMLVRILHKFQKDS